MMGVATICRTNVLTVPTNQEYINVNAVSAKICCVKIVLSGATQPYHFIELEWVKFKHYSTEK